MKQAMLITVGVGETVADPISISIQEARPDFVLFLVTEQSKGKTLPQVLAKTGLDEGNYECWDTTNENDVEKCVIDYTEAIQYLLSKGYSPEEVVADFTSGTKVMSAALVAAGLEKEVQSLRYIHGERGEGGRVISGTERSGTLRPKRLMARRDLLRAVELFNTFRFDACLEVLEIVFTRTEVQETNHRAEVLMELARGYRAWDQFDHEQAMERLKGLSKETLLGKWGLKRRVEEHKAFLHPLLQEKYSLQRAVDLWNNSERRAGEGRLDDAVARIYRLLEYIAQIRLYKDYGGLETGDIDIEKLPEHLREAYEPCRSQEGKIELGLVQAYGLLQKLEDPVGKQFMAERCCRSGEVNKVLGMRNDSILAHGFRPVGERGYKRGIGVARRYLDAAFGNWEAQARKAAFPKLDLQVIL